MVDELIFVSRLTKLEVTDTDGARLGKVTDVVLVPAHKSPPRALGFVLSVQRRRVFVALNRVEELHGLGLRLRSAAVDLHRFEQRPGEILASSEILGTKVNGSVVNDIALRKVTGDKQTLEVAAVSVATPGGLRRRRSTRVVDWREVSSVFETGAVSHEVASMRDMHPSDVARFLRSLPLKRRQQLASELEDERLADLLEELPEDEQLRIVEGIDLDRLAHVIEEMDPDDAVDLLAEMPRDQRLSLLASMDPEGARPLRQLLVYAGNTAGGLMTSEPVILPPDVTVAEALARVREFELAPVLAAQVFVCVAPTSPPTGTFLGSVGIQRMLREPPSSEIGRCIEGDPEFIDASTSEHEVARKLAAYDLLAIAVCDKERRLLGAVTVDDMMDHLLPDNWRRGR